MEVAQTLNISRASERLGITQPSLSTSIKRLEDSLNTQLLIRSRSGVQLTKAGTEFLNHSRKLLEYWEETKRITQNQEQKISGVFKIGVHPSVALYTLKEFLPQLLSENQSLEIQLSHDLSRKITEKVISFELDFGIVVNPVRHPDLVLTELCRDEVSFWVSQNNKLSQANLDTLICDMDLNQSQDLLQKIKNKKLKFTRYLSSKNLEVICDLTAHGCGVGILPKRVATRVKEYKLKLYDENLPVFQDKIFLAYRSDYQKSVASKAIVKAIKESFLG